MDSSLFDYDLPHELIAQSPVEPRDSSRLLVLPRAGDSIEHRHFRDLAELLEPEDVLVLNDTRVSARRLFGRRPSGGAVELLLMRSLGGNRYQALTRPARRLRPGERVIFDDAPEAFIEEVGEGGQRVVRFDGPLGDAGEMPLPPYFHGTLPDPERYQTVYAAEDGSSAAPTAGLHFTQELLTRIERKGVRVTRVTLHVGLDTFRPLPEGPVEKHKMHGETYTIPEETANAVRFCSGRVIAVGTTAVRVLESAGPREQMEMGQATTRLFIRPGYEFRCVEGIVTNFHLPRTTMLLMICAFAGRERVLAAYEEAKRAGYRFLSFGDAMAIL
ncbi:MAG: tRNA preQ1(34) S-adenosylmethionine ribosyltransferase-isomerase QueA [Fimbriimonadia bacterium]|jgi:S-adenosylmethionine:tRNA ribosyltransferase-isomerase